MALRKTSRTLRIVVCSGAILGFIGGSGFAAPRLQTGPDAEVTHDGLHRVDRTVMEAAWVKPDLDLTGYDKLMLIDAGFAYRAVDNEGERYVPGRSNDSEFYIDQETRERIEEEMREEFSEELARIDNYEIVTEPTPGTLLLVAGVYDLVSTTPPVDSCVGRCEVYLSSVGAATLILELRDSVSSEILARVVDPRAAETAGWGIEVNSVTVWAEVRRLASFWARRVRTGLENIETVDDLAPRRR